jgi:hypothetical protein
MADVKITKNIIFTTMLSYTNAIIIHNSSHKHFLEHICISLNFKHCTVYHATQVCIFLVIKILSMYVFNSYTITGILSFVYLYIINIRV